MKEKLLIVGAGGFGRVTLEHAIKDFDCSFVDDGKSIGEEINGIKVILDYGHNIEGYKKVLPTLQYIGSGNIEQDMFDYGYLYFNNK